MDSNAPARHANDPQLGCNDVTTSYSYHAAGQAGALAVASIDGPRANDTLTL